MTCQRFNRLLRDRQAGVPDSARQCECGLDVNEANAPEPCGLGLADVTGSEAAPRAEPVSGATAGPPPTSSAASVSRDEEVAPIQGATPVLQIIDYTPLLGERGDWLNLHLRVDAEAGRYEKVEVRIDGRLPSPGKLELRCYDPWQHSRFETRQFTASVREGGSWVAAYQLECTDPAGRVHRFWAEDTLPIVFGTDDPAVMRQSLTPYVAGFRSTIRIDNRRTGVFHSYRGLGAADIEVVNEGVISVGEFNAKLSDDLRDGATLSKSLYVLPVEARYTADGGPEGLLERVNAGLPRGGIGFAFNAVRTRGIGGVVAETVRVGQSLRFSLRIDRPGYLTLIDIGTSGAVYLLSPNAFITPEAARVTGASRLQVPGSNVFDSRMDLTVNEPTGNEQLIALLTPRPLIRPEWLRGTSRDLDAWDSGEGLPLIGLDEAQLMHICAALDDAGDDWYAGSASFRVLDP